LPAKQVAIGEKWEIAPAIVARLLGLETAGACEVRATLEKVSGGVAVVLVEGSGSGVINGVTSDIDLKARYGFDTSRRRIAWLSLSMREHRAIGRAEPGYEAVFRVQFQAEPKAALPAELGNGVVQKLPKKAGSENLLLAFSSAVGDIALLFDRRWYVTSDDVRLLQLRLVEENAGLAQCNLSRPAKLEAGKRLTLAAFKQDIQQTLGKGFGEFADSSERTSDDGLSIYRVMVTGTISDVQVIWVYYHLLRTDGERLALVFTCESDKYESLVAAEESLIASLRFTPNPTPQAAAQAADPQAAEPAEGK